MKSLLSLLTFLPIAGAVLVAGLPARQARLARALAMGCSLANLLLAGWLAVQFDPRQANFQFVERVPWIASLGVDYHLGVDGLGLLLVGLTALVVPLAMLAAWGTGDRAGLYFSLVLLLEAGLIGTFTALNFFHWFLFWELSLVPAFFLIRFWGGPERGPAAVQFFVYTMVGSVALLLAFLALYLVSGTFDFLRLAELARVGPGGQSELQTAFAAHGGLGGIDGQTLRVLIFAGLFLGFAVKVPLMPFHTWLPTAYAEAPSATTMLLTGLMSKMGVYGFLRLTQPLFPDLMRAAIVPLLGLAVWTIVGSAACALVQRDLKRVLAYSSINHLGYCLLGIFALNASATGTGAAVGRTFALNGILLQLFNHGLTASVLFFFVAALERRSQGLRGLDDFGGLRRVAPVYCGLMGITFFASLGLPGLNGFVGEFLIFRGVFSLSAWAAAASTLGLLLTALFLLNVMQRMFHGAVNPRWQELPDLSGVERWAVAPAIGLMLLLGLYPQWLMERLSPTVLRLLAGWGY